MGQCCEEQLRQEYLSKNTDNNAAADTGTDCKAQNTCCNRNSRKETGKAEMEKDKQCPANVVYRATSKNGKYKAVSTIKKGSTVSYTNKKLTSKKTYYYKVRAYRVVNGKKVYSGYSKVKGVKIK